MGKTNNQELNEKIKIIDFIGSVDFIELISKETLSTTQYNNLFLHHVLVIISQSTGIKEGGAFLTHIFDFDDNIWKPHIEYHYYTIKNTLIESSRNSNGSSIKIKNKKHNYPYHDSLSFKKFITNYNQNLKINDTDDFTSKTLFFYKRGKNKEENICSYYKTVIESDCLLMSILLNYFMRLNLPSKPIAIKPLKI